MTTRFPPLPRTLIGTSTKSYLGAEAARSWGPIVLARLQAAGVDPASTYICPASALIPLLRDGFGAGGGVVGAQDVSAYPPGPFTGEVSAPLLAELGTRMVMAGHPERRRLFAESDDTVSTKVRVTAQEGMAPVVVVGEAIEGESAIAAVSAQIEAVVGNTDCPGGLVVAYEPAWAIGRDRPAPAEHIAAVVRALRNLLAPRGDSVRVLYGGSAQPGTFTAIAEAAQCDAQAVPDGVFLGRAGVDPDSFAKVAAEVWNIRERLVV
ncbi:triosephosphate isomerase [Branchiibius hedensis]|uniref:Triosephosphate isomerase n=1 Tax=Branchiibius hedensis TaxID=672460 RepID=A0A2Y9C1F8_9MICO|nr:triose-phosphate isomerase family protein [Branchiibius hedensis]PWJ25440.1 triosephosphate isomerase [Branchiibius hedensis]SSA34253.1 triosephosphate isomerase [Branchiibius hedensis]